jgi:hypothetical protein
MFQQTAAQIVPIPCLDFFPPASRQAMNNGENIMGKAEGHIQPKENFSPN